MINEIIAFKDLKKFREYIDKEFFDKNNINKDYRENLITCLLRYKNN